MKGVYKYVVAVIWSNFMVSQVVNLNDYSQESRTPMEIPVMKINVFMMGQTEVNPEITVLINDNIKFLNEEFEGYVEFEFDELFMDYGQAYLPDLYEEYMKHEETATINALIKPIEKKGAINVFLFDTYAQEGTDRALMGFTPRLRTRENEYALNSPNFDRIYMAYDGLYSKSTLVHEMGHFLGLHHPWEMLGSQKLAFGMRTSADESLNHMSYGVNASQFTRQQLEAMQRHALKYRKYLMDRVVKVYAHSSSD